MKGERLLDALGTMSACAAVVLLNGLSAGTYRRFDLTRDARFSLSEATKSTLRDLSVPVEAWVFLARTDPLESEVRHLLDAYRGASSHLSLHFVDPDRDPVALAAARERFGIDTVKIEDGRVLADAVVVVVSGDAKWFVTASELSVRDEATLRLRSRAERALTLALRNVGTKERSKLCFTTGHGEAGFGDEGPHGLAHLRGMLEKENFELAPLSTGALSGVDPARGCTVVFVGAPKSPFSKGESAALRTYLLTGGNLFVAASPFSADNPSTSLSEPGLDDALEPFGIAFERALVVEKDPARAIAETRGLELVAMPGLHAISETLAATESRPDPPRIFFRDAAPLARRAADANVVGFVSSSETSLAESSRARDGRGARPGPFALGLASERAKLRPTDPHGPRVVAFGTDRILDRDTFLAPLADHGGAFLVENAIAWLTARPDLVDVPERSGASTLRWTEKAKKEVATYVLLLMPLAILLLGATLLLVRRSKERGIDGERG